jgi:hypothetical protein
MSVLFAKQQIEQLSPITREVFDRLNLLHQQDWSPEQKQEIQAQMMAMLTPEQRATVERETVRAAINLQFANPKQGNRQVRRNLRARQRRNKQ